MSKDLYQVLRVTPEATVDEIKKAYRKLALEYHPDKCKSSDADARFKEILNAYQVLTDERQREIYDAQLAASHAAAAATSEPQVARERSYRSSNSERASRGGDFQWRRHFTTNLRHDIFTEFWAGVYKEPHRDVDLHLTLEELFTGCSKTVVVPQQDLVYDGIRKPRVPISFVVHVFPGEKDGDTKYYADSIWGYMEHDLEGSAITVTIRQIPHATFTRDNDDLKQKIRISESEVLNGFCVQAPLLIGSPMRIRMSPGIVLTDRVLRLDGSGMPVVNRAECFGDMLVEFDIAAATSDGSGSRAGAPAAPRL